MQRRVTSRGDIDKWSKLAETKGEPNQANVSYAVRTIHRVRASAILSVKVIIYVSSIINVSLNVHYEVRAG